MQAVCKLKTNLPWFLKKCIDKYYNHNYLWNYDKTNIMAK